MSDFMTMIKGKKTYILGFVAVGSLACEMMGFGKMPEGWYEMLGFGSSLHLLIEYILYLYVSLVF